MCFLKPTHSIYKKYEFVCMFTAATSIHLNYDIDKDERLLHLHVGAVRCTNEVFFKTCFPTLSWKFQMPQQKTAVTQTICCERGKHTSVSDDSRCCFTHVMNRELPAALVCCD